MKWKVLAEKGIFYTNGESSRRLNFAKDSFILPIDIKKGHITEGGIATLIKLKRIKEVKESKGEDQAKAELEAAKIEAEAKAQAEAEAKKDNAKK